MSDDPWNRLTKPDAAEWVYPHSTAERRALAWSKLPAAAAALDALATALPRPAAADAPVRVRALMHWHAEAVAALDAVDQALEPLTACVWTGPDPADTSPKPDTVTTTLTLGESLRAEIDPALSVQLERIDTYIRKRLVPGSGWGVVAVMTEDTPAAAVEEAVAMLRGFAADLRDYIGTPPAVAVKAGGAGQDFGEKEARAELGRLGFPPKMSRSTLKRMGDTLQIVFTIDERTGDRRYTIEGCREAWELRKRRRSARVDQAIGPRGTKWDRDGPSGTTIEISAGPATKPGHHPNVSIVKAPSPSRRVKP